MPHDQLRSALEAVRSRLRAELEAQLNVIERQQQDTIDAARRAADAEAHERWAIKLEQVRSEWASRLETELAAAAADADRRTVAETTRARLETEQAAADAIAQVKQQASADAERASAEGAKALAESERARAELQKALDEERERSKSAIAAAESSRTADEGLKRELEREAQRADALAGELAQLKTRFELERGGLSTSLDAERERARLLAAEVQSVRKLLEDERTAARAAAETAQANTTAVTEARALERQSQLAVIERLLDSVRAISNAQSLSDVLAMLVASAASEVPRAALLIVNGQELQGFKVSGFDQSTAALRIRFADNEILREAVAVGEPASVTAANAPAFARLSPDRAGLVVPIRVGGQSVAVLYADDVSSGEPDAPASWPEAVEILCRHAAETLAHLTAVRTVQAARLARGSSARPMATTGDGSADDDQAARRYARLLVSEIKLYNEAAVRLGREKRDLLTRLKPEVERAKRLYEERVPQKVVARGAYFHQELVQTLADGDPSLLGSSTVTS